MKDGLRFVDCDMHIMEPVDLLDKYLDKKFRDRVILPVDAQGKLKRGMIVIDGQPTSLDHELQQHRKRSLPKAKMETSQPLSGSRMAAGGYLNFAIERNYDAEAQVMGMELEGIDLAVMFPTMGLSLIARDNMDPHLALAKARCGSILSLAIRLSPMVGNITARSIPSSSIPMTCASAS